MLSGNEFLPSVSHSLASFLSSIRHILYFIFLARSVVISIFHFFPRYSFTFVYLFFFFTDGFDIVCGAVSQFAKCHVATFSSFRLKNFFSSFLCCCSFCSPYVLISSPFVPWVDNKQNTEHFFVVFYEF